MAASPMPSGMMPKSRIIESTPVNLNLVKDVRRSGTGFRQRPMRPVRGQAEAADSRRFFEENAGIDAFDRTALDSVGNAGRSSAWLERLVWDQKAAGSN